MARAGSLLFLAAFASAATLAAQELSFGIQPGIIRSGGEVRISLTLEGGDTGIDVPEPPVRNLRIVGGPYSSSEFQWINGVVQRQRIIEWRAVAGDPGVAEVGPLVLRDGTRMVRIGPASTSVVPPGSPQLPSAPSQRESVQVRLDLSSTSVAQGEQLYATWTLVAREPVRDVNVIEAPGFEGFWVEYLPLSERRDRQVWLDGVRGYEVTLRRAVLYPLRSGAVTISPMRVEADILVPARDSRNPLSIFEGRIESIAVASSSAEIDVTGIPARAQLTGRASMRCTPPNVGPGGNVWRDVTIVSDGNLRLTTPPALASEVTGRTEVEDLGTELQGAGLPLRMSRSWRVQVFPASAGALTLPRLVYRVWDPAQSKLVELACAGAELTIQERTAGDDSVTTLPGASESRSIPWGWVAGGLLVVAAIATVMFAARWRSRRSRIAPDLDELAAPGDVRDRRRRLENWLAERGHDPYALAWAEGELGEAWREVLSLLEREQREPLGDTATEDFRRRVQRVIEATLAD